MADGDQVPFTLLLGTGQAEVVPAVEAALRNAGIPFQSGLQTIPSPRVLFSVPESRLDEARDIVARLLTSRAAAALPLVTDGREEEEEEEEQEQEEEEEEHEEEQAPQQFPWGPVSVCFGLLCLHLAIVLGLVGQNPSPAHLATIGGLVGSAVASEPWRLLTYIFVHSDPKHALWNGISMVVFAVPLVGSLGWARTAAAYLAAGIGGGIAAVLTSSPRTVTIGASGAVAGLFGAWLVLALKNVRHAPVIRRARLQIAGISLLLLPSLVTPTTSDGGRISVAAHLGGLATGALLAPLLSRLRR